MAVILPEGSDDLKLFSDTSNEDFSAVFQVFLEMGHICDTLQWG